MKKLLQLLSQSFDNEFVFSVFSTLKNTVGFITEFPHISKVRAQTLVDIKSFKQFKFRDVCVIECYMFSDAPAYERVVQVYYKYQAQKNKILSPGIDEKRNDDRNFEDPTETKHTKSNILEVRDNSYFLDSVEVKKGDIIEALYDDSIWYKGKVIGFTNQRVKLHFPDDNTERTFVSHLRIPR